MSYDTVSFLTDLGNDSEVPGVLHAIVRDIAPHASVIHLSHAVEPYDVRGGALALARAIGYLPRGVVVAAVDPATDRPAIAIEVAGGEGVLVGPDNGLLAPAAAMAGGAERAVLLENDEFHLNSPGTRFIVRDVFAAVAAHLCAGAAFGRLGPAIDTGELLPGVIPISRTENGELVAEVLHVDRFGHIQLNIDPHELAALGDTIRVRLTDMTRTAHVLDSIIGLHEGQLALVSDPYGLVQLAVARSSAAGEIGLTVGDAVYLSAAGEQAIGTTTPVQFRR